MTGNANTGGAVGGEGEMRGVEGGRDERHARERALREVRAVFIDHQKTAIADQAEGIDISGGDGATAEGFDGVEEEAGEVHRVRSDDDPVVFSQRNSGDVNSEAVGVGLVGGGGWWVRGCGETRGCRRWLRSRWRTRDFPLGS